MTYAQAIQFLYGLRLFGAKLGLENTFRLAELAGNPHHKLRFIHVAGTNGKGSTCAMLESIYRSTGLRVGLFTSPHLISFRERIQIQRRLIDEVEVAALVHQMRGLLEAFEDARHPTFFEVVTVMALRYFAERECELVIWETGLGGRLDATNIVTPLASVITNIQLDHEKWLGNTLAQIAYEKAGIIKPNVPIITSTEPGEALDVIAQTAARQHAKLVSLSISRHGTDQTDLRDTTLRNSKTDFPPCNELVALRPASLENLKLPLLGAHQKLNAALACATVRTLQQVVPVTDTALQRGIASVVWLGRLQLERIAPNRTILLDGAHNPAGVAALRDAVREHFPGQRFTLVLGILQDKDSETMCRILAPLAGRILLAPVSSERTSTPVQLEAFCRRASSELEVISCVSLSEALDRASNDSLLVITGSLYFVGEALELLGLGSGAGGERELNEWGASDPHSNAPATAIR